MERTNNPNGKHSPFLAISTRFFERESLTKLVERLACRNYNCEQQFENMAAGSTTIETSSVEVLGNGDVQLSSLSEEVHKPFITCFLFTCIRPKNDRYRLTWASSLS
jgi:hypothetical protein